MMMMATGKECFCRYAPEHLEILTAEEDIDFYHQVSCVTYDDDGDGDEAVKLMIIIAFCRTWLTMAASSSERLVTSSCTHGNKAT